MVRSRPAVGELHPLHRIALRHPLILDGLLDFRFAPLGTQHHRYCACTFYLVFKEPAEACPASRRLGRETKRSLQVFLLEENLTILLEGSDSCQPLPASLVVRSSATRRPVHG